MINIVLMAHSVTNMKFYSSMFERMPYIKLIQIPIDGPEVEKNVDVVNGCIKEKGLRDENIDFVLLSSNYGIPASEDINCKMFEYMLRKFKHAKFVSIGSTYQSLVKSLDLSERIFIMGTAIADLQTDLIQHSAVKEQDRDRVKNIKNLKSLIEEALILKKELTNSLIPTLTKETAELSLEKERKDKPVLKS